MADPALAYALLRATYDERVRNPVDAVIPIIKRALYRPRELSGSSGLWRLPPHPAPIFAARDARRPLPARGRGKGKNLVGIQSGCDGSNTPSILVSKRSPD